MMASKLELEYLRDLIESRSGIALDDSKHYLLESRLAPIARRSGTASLRGLIRELMSQGDEQLAAQVVEAMTTNETLFFRDRKPFKQLTDVVAPALREKRNPDRGIRIWSAAASTGQEPYSIALSLKEDTFDWSGWKVEILGSDISKNVIKAAKSGIYSQFAVQRGMPISILLKYFNQEGAVWQLKADIRDMVEWQVLNLIEENRDLGLFDVIFCRNVLIYFSMRNKRRVLDMLAHRLRPDGFLFLGTAETLVGLESKFTQYEDCHGLYVPGGTAAPHNSASSGSGSSSLWRKR